MTNGQSMLDKRRIHVMGGMSGTAFHHPTQKNLRFKPYKLYISEIFHLIFQTMDDHR